MKRLVRSVPVALLIVALSGGESLAAKQSYDSLGPLADAYLIVGGERIEMQTGMKLSGIAIKDPSTGYCQLPADGVSIEVDSAADASYLASVFLDEDCSIIVVDVAISDENPDRQPNTGVRPLSLGSTHRHRGWAKGTVFEQFGVTATETYSTITYYQDQTHLWGGYAYDQPSSYCYHSSFPGWYPAVCTNVELSTSGPQEIVNKWDGHYYNYLSQTEYNISARFRAVKTDTWTGTCTLYNGSLPPFWSFQCTNGRTGAF